VNSLATAAMLLCLAGGVFARAGSDAEAASEYNVNSRYTVESIVFAGGKAPRVSDTLKERIQRLVGRKLNSAAIEGLCRQVGEELRSKNVRFHLVRGSRPELVGVVLDVEPNPSHFDVNLPRVVYNSALGWTAEGAATAAFGTSVLTLTAIRDAEDMAATVGGFRAAYQNNGLMNGAMQLSVQFEDFQNSYQSPALVAAGPSEAGLIRSSWDVLPAVHLLIGDDVTLTAGFEIEQLHPLDSAARAETVNSLVNTLRFQRQWTGADDSVQELEAGYALQAAARTMGSDFGFAKQQFDARYRWRGGRHRVEASMLAGTISGVAPLPERFVLGDSTTLRGWNRFDIDPLGGDRAAEASLTYGYRAARVFYDTGSVWLRGESPELRQSVGAGIERERMQLAVAFPLCQGRVEPVLIAGMNF
jgi:hypothetical protein